MYVYVFRFDDVLYLYVCVAHTYTTTPHQQRQNHSSLDKQRRQSLEMLRAMRRPAYPVFAFRRGKWQEVSSEALLPGAF